MGSDRYPDWVLDCPVRYIKRFSTSRGFWPKETPDDLAEEMEPQADELVDDEASLQEGSEELVHGERKTIRESLAECGQNTIVLERVIGETKDECTTSFVASFDLPFAEAVQALGHEAEGLRFLTIDADDLCRLQRAVSNSANSCAVAELSKQLEEYSREVATYNLEHEAEHFFETIAAKHKRTAEPTCRKWWESDF